MLEVALPVTTTATTYSISCLPDDRVDGGTWTITVRFIGGWSYREPRPLDQQWVIEHREFYLDRDGGWWSPPGSDGQWERHRFSLEDAMRLAQEHAPKLEINGLTVADVIERRRQRAAEEAARVQSTLASLDGTTTGRVATLSGLRSEEINELGGIGEEAGEQ